MPLSIDRYVSDACARVIVRGEIDMATRFDLVKALDDTIVVGVHSVTVDLAEVSFMDCYGMSALILGRAMADERSCAYRIVGATGVPLLVLRVTGVLDQLS
jgi:anti-anti-sigma factor